MNTPTETPDPKPLPPKPPLRRRRQAGFAAALVAAGLVGAGATALTQRNHRAVLVSLPPAPIASMQDGNAVAVTGEVAEIYGDKFILVDPSGRALIETGPQGRGGNLVTKSETVTVQGRFDNGAVHAAALRHGDGRTVVFGPPGPPPPRPPLG